MKLPSKKIMLPMCALALVAAGGFGVAQVSAAADTSSPKASIVQKLADTFHLDKAKVQAVFDEQHKANQADREKSYEDRLTQAVTDGKLTAAQKTLVLTEHNKLKAELDAAVSASAADKTARKTAMDKVRTEAADWAKANNIDAKWLMIGGPGRGGHGFGGPGHHGGMDGHHGDTDDAAPAPSPSAS
jgi:hypothetical protein